MTLSLNLVVMWKCKNINIFSQIVTLQIGQKEILLLKKVINTVPRTCNLWEIITKYKAESV